MLFRKKQPRSCLYCKYGTTLPEEQILCSKRGTRLADIPCRRFCYDPIKRIPPRSNPLDTKKYSQEDFTL